MMKNSFEACRYKGKPAIFDKVSRVYYFGFKTMREAREKTEQLNKGK